MITCCPKVWTTSKDQLLVESQDLHYISFFRRYTGNRHSRIEDATETFIYSKVGKFKVNDDEL